MFQVLDELQKLANVNGRDLESAEMENYPTPNHLDFIRF